MKTKSTVMPVAFIVFAGLLLVMASPLSNNDAFAAVTNKPNSTILKGTLNSIQDDGKDTVPGYILSAFKPSKYANTSNIPPTFGQHFIWLNYMEIRHTLILFQTLR